MNSPIKRPNPASENFKAHQINPSWIQTNATNARFLSSQLTELKALQLLTVLCDSPIQKIFP